MTENELPVITEADKILRNNQRSKQMTDIIKCENGCEKQTNCYRWTAPSSDWQAYADFKIENGECKDYWKINE